METIAPGEGIRHISASNPTEYLPAYYLNAFFDVLINEAGEIDIKINSPQLLCYSINNGYTAIAQISTQDSTKLLLSTAAGATDQVELIKQKFRAKFWSLIHLVNARFAANCLRPRPGIGPELKSRRPFVETRARTEHHRRSPLLHIHRTANDIVTSMPL